MSVAPLARPLRSYIAIGVCALGCSWLAPLGRAYACSCMAPPAPLLAQKGSAAVFVGEALSVRHAPPAAPPADGSPGGPMGQIIVEFRVDALYKGDRREQITLRTADNSAACGRTFDRGRTYLVYANQDARGLTDSLCSRTQSDPKAIASDRLALGTPLWERGAPKAPQPEPVPETAPAQQPGDPAQNEQGPKPVTPGRRCSLAPQAPTRPGLLGLALAGLTVGLRRRRSSSSTRTCPRATRTLLLLALAGGLGGCTVKPTQDQCNALADHMAKLLRAAKVKNASGAEVMKAKERDRFVMVCVREGSHETVKCMLDATTWDGVVANCGRLVR